MSRLVNGVKARAEEIAFLGSLLLAFKSVLGGSMEIRQIRTMNTFKIKVKLFFKMYP